MKIESTGTMNSGWTGTGGGIQSDPYAKNIQNQIAAAQQKLRDLSSREELSPEDKMKKRQEIQQEINNLNQQLRQRKIEQRKEQQNQKASKEDTATGKNKASAKKASGLSKESMQAMISADSSVKQASVQGSAVTQMEGKKAVLESEIKQDGGRGNTERKEQELWDIQHKMQAATASRIVTLADANRAMKEAAGAEGTENKSDKSENKADNIQNKSDNKIQNPDDADGLDTTETSDKQPFTV